MPLRKVQTRDDTIICAFAKQSLNLGSTVGDHNMLGQALGRLEEDLIARHPDDPFKITKGTHQGDLAPQRKISEPSYAVWNPIYRRLERSTQSLDFAGQSRAGPTHAFPRGRATSSRAAHLIAPRVVLYLFLSYCSRHSLGRAKPPILTGLSTVCSSTYYRPGDEIDEQQFLRGTGPFYLLRGQCEELSRSRISANSALAVLAPSTP